MLLTWVVLLAGSMGQAQAPDSRDSLVRARHAYNTGQFDVAITAATEALGTPALANPAAVVLARAHLERYRALSVAADLDEARKALRLVVPDQLAPRDRAEYLLGLGVSLYLDGCTAGCLSAAAEMFNMALADATALDDRERVFEWWAGALDRQAQFGPQGERGLIYRRILDRAEAELSAHHQSASATYWLAAAARGAGDHERAWGAAIAGWVRARGLGRKGDVLRTDLDRFVLEILLPERARLQSPDEDTAPALDLLKQQWEEIKKKYL